MKKVVVGAISGYGRDLMETFHLPVESIYSMPNLRQWFVESTLYPFIGGDTVRRRDMKVAGLQPSVNMILPYAAPRLSGCSREALYELSLIHIFKGAAGGIPVGRNLKEGKKGLLHNESD